MEFLQILRLSLSYCILRFKHDDIFSRNLVVQWSGEIPKVDFRRHLDVPDQSRRTLFVCNILKTVEVSFLIVASILIFKVFQYFRSLSGQPLSYSCR